MPAERRQREPIADRIEHALAERADAEIATEPPPEPADRSLRRSAIWLAITGISLYLVAPSLFEVLSAWEDLDQVQPAWFAGMVASQTLAMGCLWYVQRLALHRAPWAPVIYSQLAGNALSKIAPAGGAVGGALQYRMLVESGTPGGLTASSITAVNLLMFAVVLALPILAIPALFTGGISGDLLEISLIGFGLFALLLGAGITLLAFDEPLAWIGRNIQSLRNKLRRRKPPVRNLPDRLGRERAKLLAALGPGWREALAGIAGRWAFDYLTLLAALVAVGATPNPALVLLAFSAAQMLAQIPLTPGGVGFVEAGLTATLALAGVPGAAAVLATLAYRLISYWLPLPIGLAAYAAHRRRMATAG